MPILATDPILFDRRGGECIAVHISHQALNQRSESIGADLKQPEEELVAGDHWGLGCLIPLSQRRLDSGWDQAEGNLHVRSGG
jgi:hypothetical protein